MQPSANLASSRNSEIASKELVEVAILCDVVPIVTSTRSQGSGKEEERYNGRHDLARVCSLRTVGWKLNQSLLHGPMALARSCMGLCLPLPPSPTSRFQGHGRT